ncbi:MAG: hypothetical protein HYT48_02850, partial [Candidatus Vogelbacteria bacterium]|nr:hypothetical protein [Candidatus Vogelbacteria bacterium]
LLFDRSGTPPPPPPPPPLGTPTFTVPENTLSLQYDESQSGALRADIAVDVKAVGGDVLIPSYDSGNFGVVLTNTTGRNGGGSLATSTISAPSSLASVDCSQYYGPGAPLCWRIPKAVEARFQIMRAFKPRQMFPGVYEASLASFYDQPSQTSYTIDNGGIPPNVSNQQTIIGEISPYIISVTTPVDELNTPVIVTGERFAYTGNRISIKNRDGVLADFTASSTDTQMISFIPVAVGLTVPGEYNLTVTTSNGLSNNIWLEVQSTGASIGIWRQIANIFSGIRAVFTGWR